MASNSYLDVSLIHPHPANVRESLGDLSELTESIHVHGILQPLVVQPHPRRAGHYQLLAGHRRYAAATAAGLDTVPVLVRHGVDDGQALELMLVENCQRRELGPMEKAEAMGALIHRGYTATTISRKTGLASSTVSYYLALLDLDDGSRDKVRTGELTAGAAVAAVRRTRKRTRTKAGSGASWQWEPDFLTDTHPLARKAARLCDARDHTLRRRIGKTACGQCWETAIREDERIAVSAMADDLDNTVATVTATATGPGRMSAGGQR
jgi:ParB/RepB/Spo0J family partition protein